MILSDGSELTGITGLTLTAKTCGLWEASITVLPKIIQPLAANAKVIEVAASSHANTVRHNAEDCPDEPV